MIFFAWSEVGVAAFERLSHGNLDCQLWASGDILTHDRRAALRLSGLRATEFTHEIRPEDSETLARAVDVIREHYPNGLIWVEQ